MKIALMSIVSLICASLPARAVSLDELLKKQTIEKIEPVTMGGVSVDGRTGPAVCSGLGFPRLVIVETEPCLPQEDLVEVYAAGGAMIFEKRMDKCGVSTSLKLKSVTCAR